MIVSGPVAPTPAGRRAPGRRSALRSAAMAATATAGLMTLAACGGSLASYESGRPTATRSAAGPSGSTAPAPPPFVVSLQAQCDAVENGYQVHVLQLVVAITAEGPDEPAYRAGVAKVYGDHAVDLGRAALTPGDVGLGRALLRWSLAEDEIAQFVRETVPRDGNVLELGPGNDRAKAARADAESACGRSFGA